MKRTDGQLVIITIPFLMGWGTEMQTHTLAKTLREQGWRVAICCYYEYDETTLDAFRDIGTELILLNMGKNQGVFSLIVRLRKVFSEKTPDVVHVQYMIRGLTAILASRLAGVSRVFATVHYTGRIFGWKQKIMLLAASRLSTHFFCNSRTVEKSWFGKNSALVPLHFCSRRKHSTLYNAVSVKELPPEEEMRDSSELRTLHGLTSKNVIGLVGRVSPEKGHRVIIEALPAILKEVPDAFLLVIGSGPELPSVKKMAEENGIHNRVVWIDRLPQHALFRYYRIMDVVVVPSLFEGFGLVAAEASAAGRPVVASDIDGLSEVVEHGVTGLLTTPNNSHAFSEAIICLLKNRQLATRLGENGRKIAKELFSYDRFAESIKTIYGEAC